MARPPIPHSHWIEPARLLAGEHPAGDGDESTRRRLAKLIDAGVTCFFDLTEQAEKATYEPLIAAAAGSRAVAYLRHPIRDHGVPESDARMREILAALDGALAEGRCVYLHCRAGIGRTNLVAGCWIANMVGDGTAALERLNRLWRANGRAKSWPSVPETADQAEFVRGWRRERKTAAKAGPAAPMARIASVAVKPAGRIDLRERVRGMLLGLAAGDALGHAVHGLPAGAWSDKTAMALCLADSLVSQDGNDAEDQVQRYREWQRAGLWSSTGACVGISAATAKALAAAQWSGNPYAGSHDPAHADAEPLARLGPAVAWFHATPQAAIDAAVNAVRVTHQAPLVLDSARFLAAILAGALSGADKAALLAPDFSPDPGAWSAGALRSPVREIAAGEWRGRRPRRMLRGKFAAIAALESALTAFDEGVDLAGCLAIAAARPGDAAVAASIVGQLAGAHYGASSIAGSLRADLARAGEIEALADRIVDGAPRARAG